MVVPLTAKINFLNGNKSDPVQPVQKATNYRSQRKKIISSVRSKPYHTFPTE